MDKSVMDLVLSSGGVSTATTTATGNLVATWDELTKIAKKQVGCYALYDDGSAPWQVKTFSEKTNMPASLCPPLRRSGAPTLLLGGFTMHRIAQDVDPMQDTINKLSGVTIRPGYTVLDTCMGLGYTAIGAARSLENRGQVITCEYDPASIEMAAYNPWSKELFDGSLPITIHHEDVIAFMEKEIADHSLDVIIHDPPTISLCKQPLHSVDIYKLMHRRLRRTEGQLFHYIGNPDSRESGRLFRGVMERLKTAGFQDVRIHAPAFGVMAFT